MSLIPKAHGPGSNGRHLQFQSTLFPSPTSLWAIVYISYFPLWLSVFTLPSYVKG